MAQVLSDFKKETSTCINQMKSDIVACSKLINNIDISTTSKLMALETEINVLHHRLNRSDVVISGLPSGLNDLTSAVVSLYSYFQINASAYDIHHVCYMNHKNLVLVKFNNAGIRDSLMKEYFKTRSLKFLVKIISKFKILNMDKPKAKLTMSSGNDVVYDVGECAKLFNNHVGVPI
ncbi:hypothetical protein FF38_09742 [Lucilia cuprina]|uniref:Uncharacterized protein n=1 Tax=Lucilia cuprina TaxID=7375 RepID=A0A0L0BWH7_LUCCU|nr:hypothetical protein FF38_09742 [Lucilia cuprina]